MPRVGAMTEISPQPAPARVRLWPALVVLAATSLLLAAIWLPADAPRGMRVVPTMIVGGIALLLLVGWFLCLSRLPPFARKVGLGVLVVTGIVVAGLVRIDGWDGDMFPLLAWRWTPTAEERFRQSRAARPAADAAEETNADVAEGESAAAEAADSDFPQFLGPRRLGVVEGIVLETDWEAHPPRELWRQPIGLGWSGFAVVGRRAVTQEQRDTQEVVVCYDLETGAELWVHAEEARFREALGGDGPRATPTIHNGLVYTQGATGLLTCLDLATGERRWSTNILADNGSSNISWGMSASPLVAGRSIVVSPGVNGGGKPGTSLAAYDLQTGAPVWAAGEGKAAYASPQLTGDGRTILMFNGPGLTAHDAVDGRVLWSHPWTNLQQINCAQPLVLSDYGYDGGNAAGMQVLVSSGYGQGTALLEVEDGGVREVWTTTRLKAKFSNMVVHGGFVYGLDEGLLICLDLADGAPLWKGSRYGHGQLLLVGDVLLIQSEPGDVVLVEASPDDEVELARYPALSDKTWNNPTLTGRRLLLRNDREAVCLELPVK